MSSCAAGFSDPRLRFARALPSRSGLLLRFRLGPRGLRSRWDDRRRGRRNGRWRRRNRCCLGDDLEDEILLLHAVPDLHADLLPSVRTRDDGVFDLKGIDRLLDVRRRALDLYLVPDRDRAVRQTDRRDAEVSIVVEHLPDLPPLHRITHGLYAINMFANASSEGREDLAPEESLKCKQEISRPRKGGNGLSW